MQAHLGHPLSLAAEKKLPPTLPQCKSINSFIQHTLYDILPGELPSPHTELEGPCPGCCGSTDREGGLKLQSPLKEQAAEGRKSPCNLLGPQTEKEEGDWAEEERKREDSCWWWSEDLIRSH